ncbi:MAG: fimbrial biogenesis outer membrane usher protein [Allosphingosinicella sp.]
MAEPPRLRPVRAALLAGACLTGWPADLRAAQPGATPQAQERRIVIEGHAAGDAGAKINPTGKTVRITVPAKDGPRYLGDIGLSIDPDDRIEFSAQRALDLLSNVLDAEVQRTLRAAFAGDTVLTPRDFEASGIRVHYNPQTLELQFDIASERRASRTVQVSPLDRDRIGSFVKPAGFSAYVNVRSSLDYLHQGPDEGLQTPVLFLDGAARIGAIVAETEAIWQPDSRILPDYQRLGSRLVYDDQKNLIRWSAGDLQPVARGFQSAPDIAGLSLFRSYSVLQPQTITRPRGDRSFRLERPATVEVQVNGQMVRRLQLNPGTYDLRDFPFTQGSNDIRINVIDDAGRTELLRFNVFLDQSQLAKGLSEFGVYFGVHSPLLPSGPHYTDQPAFTGFYRRGLSDTVTLGINAQADKRNQMGGLEAVFATVVGTISTNFSLSNIDRFGTGWAGVATFQRLIQRSGGRADSLNLSVEARSRRFGPVGTLVPVNPFEFEIGAGYSHAFNDYVYGGFDGRYSKGRGIQPDVGTARVTMGWRINPRISFTADGRYERDNLGERVAGLFSLTVQLGHYSSVRGDYDTHDNRARVSFQTLHGTGVGSYNLNADIERSDVGSGANLNADYFANRAEIGLSHFGTFQGDFSSSTSQRTSLRVATSFAFADGAFSMGRPIYDSFAIVRGHPSLKGADVLVDPSAFGFTANTGFLNAATEPNLSSYSERTVTIDAPGAPAGIDLGQGSFRLLPPYRSGYKLIVGSDYGVTAIGRMLNRDGEPVSLVAGTAVEAAHPDRPPVELFTNRDGRFGAAGLAPGRWKVTMLDDAKSEFEIDIPPKTEGVVRLGEIKASPPQ